MTLTGTITIAAPPEQVWRFLLDPATMKQCLPYCDSLEMVDDRTFRSVVTVKVSAIEAQFTLRTTVTEQQPFKRLRTLTEGEDRRLASLVRQENDIRLTPAGDGGTELSYQTDFTVTGRLGKLGLTVFGTKARKMAAEFAASLKKHIEASGSPAREAQT